MRDALVREALKWPGREFHPGVPAQCAAWVSSCLDAIGYDDPKFEAINKNWVPDFSGSDNGKPIGKRLAFKDLAAGDLVIFGQTYQDATSTHIGIYIGDGWMVHRPTAARPVEKADISQGYWLDHFEIGIQLWPKSTSPAPPPETDGPGTADPDTAPHTMRLDAHDGKIGLRIDGKMVDLIDFSYETHVVPGKPPALTLTLTFPRKATP